METNNGQDDRKIISIHPGELIASGRALNLYGYAFVNYQTLTVKDWEEACPHGEICMIGKPDSSYISNQSIGRA